MPFVAYLPTEQLGGSGLVAAVVAGIVTGQGAARWFTPEQRLSDELNWRTVELMLEGAVFLVMGLELKEIVEREPRRTTRASARRLARGWPRSASSSSCAPRYVAVLVWSQGRRARRLNRERAGELRRAGIDEIEARRDRPAAIGGPRRTGDHPSAASGACSQVRTRVARALADLDYYQASPLGWKHGTVIVWAGMRGVVTLAAAQTLPRDTPERALLVFVAFLVAVGSLMLQGFTLPWLVRLLKLEGVGRGPVLGRGAAPPRRRDADRPRHPASPVGRTRAPRRLARSRPSSSTRVGSRMTQPPDDDMSARAHDVLELRLALIEAMRVRLNALSRDGTFSTAALRHALAELDADQLSLELRLDDDGADRPVGVGAVAVSDTVAARGRMDSMSETTDAAMTALGRARRRSAHAETSPLHLPHQAADCPKCFTELQRDRDWWLARPAGHAWSASSISRDDMPSCRRAARRAHALRRADRGLPPSRARDARVVAGPPRAALRHAAQRRRARRGDRARARPRHRRGDPHGRRAAPPRRRREGARATAAATSTTPGADRDGCAAS